MFYDRLKNIISMHNTCLRMKLVPVLKGLTLKAITVIKKYVIYTLPILLIDVYALCFVGINFMFTSLNVILKQNYAVPDLENNCNRVILCLKLCRRVHHMPSHDSFYNN